MFAVYVSSILTMIVLGRMDVNVDYGFGEVIGVTLALLFMGSWICITFAGPVLAMKKKRPGIAFLSFLFTPIGFFFALGAEDRSSSKLVQQVAGTWYHDKPDTITLAPDGSFSRMLRKPGHTDSFAGTWQIKDRVLIITITSASDAMAGPLIGGVELWNIVRVDDHQLVYEQSGQTHTLSR